MPVSKDLFNKIRDKHGEYASWAIWQEPDLSTVPLKPKMMPEVTKKLDAMGIESPYNIIGTGASLAMDIDIFQNVSEEILCKLNPNFILLGLNFSTGKVNTLMNFHSKDGNIGKLRYAIRKSPFSGAYMTDIIKNYSEPNANELMKYLRENKEFEQKNVRDFENEISILGTENPVIIALGNDVYKILKRNGILKKYKVVKITHYSAPLSCPIGEAGEYHKDRVMPVLVQALTCKSW